jgi:hypothetical protein
MPRYFVHVFDGKCIVATDGEGQQIVLKLCFCTKEIG